MGLVGGRRRRRNSARVWQHYLILSECSLSRCSKPYLALAAATPSPCALGCIVDAWVCSRTLQIAEHSDACPQRKLQIEQWRWLRAPPPPPPKKTVKYLLLWFFALVFFCLWDLKDFNDVDVWPLWRLDLGCSCCWFVPRMETLMMCFLHLCGTCLDGKGKLELVHRLFASCPA